MPKHPFPHASRHLVVLAVCCAPLLAASCSRGAAHGPRFSKTTPELERRDQPVTQEDLAILVRADALLPDENAWNRHDDRKCDDDEAAGKRSLFCALSKASAEVLGQYEHRRVAVQEVRFAVNDASPGQTFEHRLMDYNNRAETQFADVKGVLAVATERVRGRLENGAH